MSRPDDALRIAIPAPSSKPDGAEARRGAINPWSERAGPVTQLHRSAELETRVPASGAAVAAIEVIGSPDRDLVTDEFARAAGSGEPRHVPGKLTARIYRRGRSPAQSARVRERTWLLTFQPRHRTEIDFLMGWTGSRDTLQQVDLQFSTLEEAVAFAERRGLAYLVEIPRRLVVRPKNYANNFRYDRLLAWTH